MSQTKHFHNFNCHRAFRLFNHKHHRAIRHNLDQRHNLRPTKTTHLRRNGQADQHRKRFHTQATTDENGTFSFRGIQPDVYRLEVEINGFKKFLQTEVRAVVDSPTKVSAILEVGNISEIVIIKSDSIENLRNTQDATLGNSFNSTQVTQLPTEARDVINLLTLQSGVTRFVYVAGGRSDQANITVDGIDVNDPIFNGIFSPNLRLNAEAIEEFRVTTVNANASQGRSSGAQISLVTKSGTNNLRGAIFLTGRRTAWTANDLSRT